MVDSLLSLEDLAGLCHRSSDDLDIARMNLLSARHLPGTEDADLETMLARIDDWADQVRFEIARHLYRFDPRTSEPQSEFNYGNSLGRFCCWFLLQVLQEDCGVRYHADRKFQPDFAQPQDLFIHGILAPQGQGGTCTSMPVVYVAVGRRLGFPLSLVESRGHLLFRWDNSHGTLLQWRDPDLKLWIPPDRFNVEGAGEGIAYYPDSHYLQWPELWTEIDFEHGRYLRSMTHKEELASFLVQRAECFADLHDLDEALKAIHYARKLCPDDRRYEQLHARRTREYHAHQEMLDRVVEMDQERRRRLQRLEEQQQKRPNHGPSCQCWDCQQSRETAKPSTKAFGHPPRCHCPQCYDPQALPQIVNHPTQRPGVMPLLMPASHSLPGQSPRLGLPGQ